jgi:protein-S-isoprenylcysteine O-methyltransferase Ste14
MPSFAGPFIAVCWLAFFAVWIIAAFFTKRTAERAGWWSGWWIWLALAAIIVARRRSLPFSGGAILWHPTPAVGIVADTITSVGLLVTVWARVVLGGNWSSNVVLKERHELIQRGPYRVVRHPIYTGVLLMLLGTMLLWGRVVGVVLFGISVAGLSVKASLEERLLMKHFPETYQRYRERVKAAIIPFVV